MSLWKRIQAFFSGKANWPEDTPSPTQAARKNMEQTTAQFTDVLSRSREAVAQYGASVRKLEGELQTLLQQREELAQLIETHPEDPSVPEARTTQEQVDQRIAQINQDLLQGREAFEALRSQLNLLQDKLKTAQVKLEEFKIREQAEETQAALDQTLKDLEDSDHD